MAIQASEVPRAVAAARSTASALGLTADEAIVLHASNRLAVRLLPADVLARVALPTHEAAAFEVDLAARLAATDAPSRLHLGMQHVDVATPHFTDRAREAQLLVGSRDRTPELGDADRDLLIN